MATSSAVDTVLVAGEPWLHDGRVTRVNKAEVLKAPSDRFKMPLQAEEERPVVSRARGVSCTSRRFYDGWLNESKRDPFYLKGRL